MKDPREVFERRTRPGGRSARVRDDVFTAALSLLAEGREPITIAAIADRSRVHHATIYRRWETAEAVVLEAATDQLDRQSPLPDTGSLRGDLLKYLTRFSEMVQAPAGGMMLRAVIATATPDGRPGEAAQAMLVRRAQQIQALLDRASARGEPSLGYVDVLDELLAPVYIRSVFGVGGVTEAWLQLRVDRLLGGGAPAATPGGLIPLTAPPPRPPA